MVYTVKNRCIEDDSVEYEDGAVKIFLYTKGTKGNPGQNLIDMLKYIQQSTEENVVNQDIETVHTMVKHIKGKKEVGIGYMKAWEWEEYIREDAAREAAKMVEERTKTVVEEAAKAIEEKEKAIEEAAKEREKAVEEATKREQEKTREQERRAEQAEAEVRRLQEELKRITALKVV